jgi:hypothetical protein
MHRKRYPANLGSRVDVESDRYVAQVKHVARLSLGELERLVTEVEAEGRRQGKCGLVIVKRRGGGEHTTTRWIVVTERVWRTRGVTLGNCIYSDSI